MKMTKKEMEDPFKSLRDLGAKLSFEIFRSAVTTIFKKAGKAMSESICDDSEVMIRVDGKTKDPNKHFHYRSVIFDCRDTLNWYFYTDRDTIGEWKRIYVAQDLIEELNTIKEKFEKDQISIEVRVFHSKLELN